MSDELVQVGFNWQKEVAETHALLCEFGDALKLTNDLAIKIGQKFRVFQDKLPRGEFLPFLDRQFGMSRARAYRFMSLAETEEEEPDKFLIMRNYSLTLQYELAPASLDVVKKVESGEVPATVKDIQEAKRAEKEAKNAQRQAEQARKEAEQKAETTQQQLAIFSQLSQDKITELTGQIIALREQAKAIAKPDAIEVIPPAIKDQIARLEAQITELTQQKKLISDKAMKLATDLKEMRETTKLQRDQELYTAQIKGDWKKATDALFKALSQFTLQIPSPIAIQVFDADEWARYDQIEQALHHFQAAFTGMKTARYSDQFVESSVVGAID